MKRKLSRFHHGTSYSFLIKTTYTLDHGPSVAWHLVSTWRQRRALAKPLRSSHMYTVLNYIQPFEGNCEADLGPSENEFDTPGLDQENRKWQPEADWQDPEPSAILPTRRGRCATHWHARARARGSQGLSRSNVFFRSDALWLLNCG